MNRLKKIKINYFILVLSLAAFFFYTFNLKESLAFFNDTARDTVKMLELIQEKKFTLIGPPLSLGQFGTREAYFGSLAYYIGIAGLILAKLEATGAIYPNIFFFTISIYFFNQLIVYLTKSKKTQTIATVLYALSPATTTFSRMFWNPNLIIPGSVFFWWLMLKKHQSPKNRICNFFLAGLLGGLMINFHYAAVIPLLLIFLYLIWKKKLDLLAALFFGCFIASLPLIFFELRHQFYLTNALFFNLKHGFIKASSPLIFHFFDFLFIIFGFLSTEMQHPFFSIKSIVFYPALAVCLGFLIIKTIPEIKEKKMFLILILLMNLIAMKVSGDIFNIHYLFSIYPLIIWFGSELLTRLKINALIYAVFGIAIYSSILIMGDSYNIKKDYLSISKIEAVSSYIAHDNPASPYNITENITSGAQGIPFRYVINRDAKVKMNNKESYIGLRTLYVVTADINKTYRENRYEFYATPNKVLTKVIDFGEVKLFKFEAK